MEPSRDDVLFATLESLRPAPSPAFAAELDARAAAGFPRHRSASPTLLAGLTTRIRALRPRQLVLGGGAAALATVAIATVVVATGPGSRSGSDSEVHYSSGSGAGNEKLEEPASGALEESASGPATAAKPASPSVEKYFDASGPAAANSAGAAANLVPEARNLDSSLSPTHRDVQRSAQMVLGTEPAAVGDAAAKVFAAVHDYRGIVLSSSVNGGSEAGSAHFEMLIPSAKLGDALAALSEIAEVRYRHEGTLDITAPTVTTADALRDSQARIDSLLNELAGTETEVEREAVEAKLRSERRHAGVLESSLSRLERRADFSLVSLRIKSDDSGAPAPGSGGGWDVGDAFHDAGKILAVAAGIAIVGLAVIGPIALIALLIWLGNRAWVRQRRERALG